MAGGSALCVFSILSPRILKRCAIEDQDLIKLIILTAVSRTFLIGTGPFFFLLFFFFNCERVTMKNVMATRTVWYHSPDSC